MNRAQFNITSFLENGALLKVASDQFNLITGPFSTVAISNSATEQHLQKSIPVVYQPHFWDFLQAHRQTLFGSQGVSSHLLTRIELLQQLEKLQPQQPKTNWQTLNSEAFKVQFDWSQQEFASNRLQKTVPIICQKSNVKLGQQNLAWMLKNLISEDLVGWTYGFWQKGTGYLGQTPELVAEWSQENQILKTVALAGTLKSSAENEIQILQDPKIHDEHQFVVDDIKKQLLQTISQKDLLASATTVHKLKHLLHLKTDFECTNISLDKALQIIQCLHPTAALGVYPRDPEEMSNFSKLELQNQRGNFAAPFAFMGTEKILCVAAIRNIYFSESELQIFSGCGVTSESQYESELSELQLKRDSVKKMMGLFE
jgi:isochorismate synthase EntC